MKNKKIHTKHCERCKHAYANKNGKIFTCDHGHRPRFYAPRFWGDDFGYRRRCEDYDEK